MSGIKIRGTGRFAPAKIVTNDDLAKIVDTSDEWITTRTGIQTRHHCTTETHTDMCVGAARQALENAGISPEDMPRIFEKGYTGYNGRLDKKSTGLGLYLCRKAADRLGHVLTAESEPGKGSRFTIDLESYPFRAE